MKFLEMKISGVNLIPSTCGIPQLKSPAQANLYDGPGKVGIVKRAEVIRPALHRTGIRQAFIDGTAIAAPTLRICTVKCKEINYDSIR